MGGSGGKQGSNVATTDVVVQNGTVTFVEWGVPTANSMVRGG